MAKLPTYRDLGGLPSGRSNRMIASYDTSAIGRGMVAYGQGIKQAGSAIANIGGSLTSSATRVPKAQQFETNRRFLEFVSEQERALEERQQSVDPGAVGFREVTTSQYDKAAREFFATVPEALKPQYDAKLFAVEDRLAGRAGSFEHKERRRYFGDELNKGLGVIENNLYANPHNFDENYAEGVNYIDSVPDENISDIEKDVLKKQWRRKAQLAALNGVSPEERIRLLGGTRQTQSADASAPTKSRPKSPILARGITEAANALGIDPLDLATAISYETGGTFNPSQKGPKTKWGRHKGLIQFGEPQARKYGVDWENPAGSQLGANGAIVRYLRDAGVQPGMGLLDVYSAINAGSVGRYNASDTAAGGAPGTVRDKVEKQMGGHRRKAAALLGVEGSGGGNFDPERADPRFADINYVDANKIILNAQREISKTESLVSADVRESYSLDIATDPLSLNQKTILSDTRLDDGDKAALINSLKSATKEVLERQGAVSWSANDNAANPYDSDDKKRATLAYEELTEGGDLDRTQQIGESITEKKGVVPKPYANDIRNNLNSNNAEAVADAMQRAQRLKTINRAALEGVEGSSEIMKAATDFETLTIDKGYTPEQAAKRFIDNRENSKKPGYETLVKEGRKLAEDINNSDVLEALDYGFVGQRFTGPEVGYDNARNAAIIGDFREIFVDEYLKDGDGELAKARAQAQMRKLYGVSDIFLDASVVTKYPPQNFYPPVGGAHDYVRSQVGAAVEDITGKKYPDSSVYLVPDIQTSKDVSSGKMPRYQIWYLDEKGNLNRAGEADEYFVPDISSAQDELRMIIEESRAATEEQRTIAEESTPAEAIASQIESVRGAAFNKPDEPAEEFGSENQIQKQQKIDVEKIMRDTIKSGKFYR